MAPNEKTTIAFAFDIDGVLMKGAELLPGARETIKMLQESNIPFIFLTNNGGQTEEVRIAGLSKAFDLPFTKRQYVQSHTPFQALVREYGDKTILAIGGHGQEIRNLAHAYGFNNVVISSDIEKGSKYVHPFPEMTKAHHDEHGRINTISGHDGTQISAILMWTSSRDWCLDLQIINDLLLSEGGRIGTRSVKNGDSMLPNHGYQQDGQPKLFFSNPDVEWVTPYEYPRLAQGAFQTALRAIWSHATNGKAGLEYTLFGKPTEATYVYAEETLLDYNESINERIGEPRKIETVYMIGDNPESDIIGANSFQSRHGLKWKSVLCETGVYIAGTTPRHVPNHTASNVQEAVEWALKQEVLKKEVLKKEGIEMDQGATAETDPFMPNDGDTMGSGDSSD
ncbi:HAD-superfamily hydrolase [Biscogniauxia marginata]|nr:HAD-superfamily hydrolase [Biscogniauxia marginata]